jgi:hypothetical protein
MSHASPMHPVCFSMIASSARSVCQGTSTSPHGVFEHVRRLRAHARVRPVRFSMIASLCARAHQHPAIAHIFVIQPFPSGGDCNGHDRSCVLRLSLGRVGRRCCCLLPQAEPCASPRGNDRAALCPVGGSHKEACGGTGLAYPIQRAGCTRLIDWKAREAHQRIYGLPSRTAIRSIRTHAIRDG